MGAALLAAGPGAALSYRSAAEFWGLRQSSRGRTEVSVPRNRRSTPRLQVHVVEMQHDEVQDEGGIRVTTPARTLFDLAAVGSYDQLAHAFNEAEYRRLSSPTSLGALLARYPKRRGTANLRRVLENHQRNGVTRTRSELERAFLSLLDAHGLPRPRTNHLTDHGELDATWPEERLVVEVDGWAGHGTRRAFEKDRARDRELVVAGWRVIRLTWRQLDEDGETIARQLSALLGATPPRRSARRARRPPPATRARRSAAP